LKVLGTLRRDLRSVLERDPAARSMLEVAVCYSGLHALWGHRVNHWLWTRELTLAARIGSSLVRLVTGVEIHPGAVLGQRVFIDHASGVVIGETAVVGDDVTIYQGVTLGGTSLEHGTRHPTIGNRVTIGAGAKILGPITIGDDSRIGANAVVVKSAPPNSVVMGVPGQIIAPRTPREKVCQSDIEAMLMPDPQTVNVQSLLVRVDELEALLKVHSGAHDVDAQRQDFSI